jgi:hypothetical protein
LDLIGLISNITDATTRIDYGRKGFGIRGKEQEGRISYETGIAKAMTVFQEAQISADPQAMLLSEYTFLTQELQLCEKTDKDSINSLTKAIQSFDDAFLALQAVVDPAYKISEKTYPHNGTYRVNGFPKDAFHIAFISHKTRLKNILRSPGIDPIEKTLLKQRLANLTTAQNSYIERQKKTLQEKKEQ